MMRLAQELFDRALKSGEHTVRMLNRPWNPVNLRDESRREILGWIADLEAITRALYTELNERDGR